MAMDKSMNQFTLPLLEFYERFFGARAELHLCVTDAMNRHLKENWAINGRALSLFDRPPTHFFEMTAEDSMKVVSIVPAHLIRAYDHTFVPSLSLKTNFFTIKQINKLFTPQIQKTLYFLTSLTR